MEIGFELNSWLPAPVTRRFAGDCRAMPEWLALQSRLGAAWSARQLLSPGAGEAAQRCGSFDHAAARELVQFEYDSRAVNPIASANRKPVWGIAGHHAGDLTSGGRG
jgi:hypothetical protein